MAAGRLLNRPWERVAMQFDCEGDLVDHFAKYVSILEYGLTLYGNQRSHAVEFPAGKRRIDLLAVDAKGGLVVVEFKLGDGKCAVLGQLLSYVAWVKRNLAKAGQQVRGFIVVKHATEDLLLACEEAPHVWVIEYLHSLGVANVRPGAFP